MMVTQCDQCGTAQPPLSERAGWVRMHYVGMSLAANLDFCPTCTGEIMAMEKLEPLIRNA
jgi:hypothetical protein